MSQKQEQKHTVQIERIYGEEEFPESYRMLVDRLWPRGVSKEKAHLDEWDKEIAPSPELRKWFGHDPEKFEEFSRRYTAELDENPAAEQFVEKLRTELNNRDVVLLFGAKDLEHNQAVVLRDYLATKL
ncbi:MAG: DUF488 family protein [Bifidobacteriaceae bacterium]|jgi:uncharacterized protein YeaO (DUF488 family)|nr:DUF488 family protein [Bifidobacteriaceae bacterium]